MKKTKMETEQTDQSPQEKFILERIIPSHYRGRILLDISAGVAKELQQLMTEQEWSTYEEAIWTLMLWAHQLEDGAAESERMDRMKPDIEVTN